MVYLKRKCDRKKLIGYAGFVTELIGYVIFGTVIQEVKTSNLAREVGCCIYIRPCSVSR